MTWFNKHDRKRLSDRDLLEHIAEAVDKLLLVSVQQLTRIEIVFNTKENKMSAAATTLQIGQMAVASVIGFDQNGQPFTGTIPQPSWSVDNPQFASITPDATNPANEDVTGVAAGVANLTAGVIVGGTTLTATAQVTVAAATGPVLSSIAIQFNPSAGTQTSTSTSDAVAAAKAAAEKVAASHS